MPAKIVTLPQQVAPPGKVGERIFVNIRLRIENEPILSTAKVRYEVQEQHAALYRVVQGESRSETLGAGDNDRRHWFILAGPTTQHVVDMRIVTTMAGGTRRRGFAILL